MYISSHINQTLKVQKRFFSKLFTLLRIPWFMVFYHIIKNCTLYFGVCVILSVTSKSWISRTQEEQKGLVSLGPLNDFSSLGTSIVVPFGGRSLLFFWPSGPHRHSLLESLPSQVALVNNTEMSLGLLLSPCGHIWSMGNVQASCPLPCHCGCAVWIVY